MDVKDQNEIQAKNKDQLEHKVRLALRQSSIEMMDRIDDQGSDMLLRYDQDVLFLLGSVVKEMLAVMEFVNHFLH